jgi:hypothetical protein
MIVSPHLRALPNHNRAKKKNKRGKKGSVSRSSSSDAPVVDTEKSDHIGDVIVGEGDENGTMSVEADTVRQPASGETESSWNTTEPESEKKTTSDTKKEDDGLIAAAVTDVSPGVNESNKAQVEDTAQ